MRGKKLIVHKISQKEKSKTKVVHFSELILLTEHITIRLIADFNENENLKQLITCALVPGRFRLKILDVSAIFMIMFYNNRENLMQIIQLNFNVLSKCLTLLH